MGCLTRRGPAGWFPLPGGARRGADSAPPMPKKLIEVALPLEAINNAAGREKSIRTGHPSTLHLWWSRKPLAAARAVLFAQLVDDPSTWPELQGDEVGQKRERERLFRLIERMVPWEASHDEAIINEARREIAQSHARFHREDPRADVILRDKPPAAVVNEYLATALPPVHDPFAGGGSIPLEAQRLGLRAIATDLNPVAVLINRALIEIPPKFAGMPPVNPDSQHNQKMRTWNGAEGLAEDVRYYGKWMRDETMARIGHLYPKISLPKEQGGGEATVIAWLWARTVRSPDPRFADVYVPLVNSWNLATKPGRAVWVEPEINGDLYEFRIRTGVAPAWAASGTKTGQGVFRCLLSGDAIRGEYVSNEASHGRMRVKLMAIVVEGKRGRVYLPPDQASEELARTAENAVQTDMLLDQPCRGTFAGNAQGRRYGFSAFRDYYSPRQLLLLTTLSGLVRDVIGKVAEDAAVNDGRFAVDQYPAAIATLLAFCVSRTSDRSSTLCTWDSSPKMEALRNTFARQGIAMSWGYAEGNPFSDSSGNWLGNVEWVANAIHDVPACARGESSMEDAASGRLTSGGVFSMDPPYYDSVNYSDLADYFYVWLRLSMADLHPHETALSLTPKTEEIVASSYRFEGDKLAAAEFFRGRMSMAFSNVWSHSRLDSVTSVYYAFKQEEGEGAEGVFGGGWDGFLSGLLNTGFVVCGTWPIRTELGNRLGGRDANSLASSIVLACRKRADDAPSATRSDFLRALKRTLPRDLKLLQQGNIAPVDFAQAAIGPGMAVFSSYAKVLESDGSAMSVRTALQIINQVLDEVLSEQEGDFDADTRCALAWFEQHQYGEAEFGSADTLARAKNTSVAGLVEAGILRSSRGKVALLTREELSADWDPATDARRTVWEVAQHLIRVLEAKGERAAGALLAKVGAQGEAARELAYRLYSLCERKKWASEALAYNGLVTAWPEVAKLAAAEGEAASAEAARGPAQGGLPGDGVTRRGRLVGEGTGRGRDWGRDEREGDGIDVDRSNPGDLTRGCEDRASVGAGVVDCVRPTGHRGALPAVGGRVASCCRAWGGRGDRARQRVLRTVV